MLSCDVDFEAGGFTLDVELETESERVAVVGPSGSGKTTLLRVVAGLERGAAARVVFRGETWSAPDGSSVPTWRRDVAWLPQDALVFPHLDARANLRYAEPDDRAFEDVVEALELDDRLETGADSLSGGERQRVALGRALLADPQLLLLDEPFSALDRRLTERISSFLDDWCDRRDCALLAAAHSAADFESLIDERYRLREGRLAELP